MKIRMKKNQVMVVVKKKKKLNLKKRNQKAVAHSYHCLVVLQYLAVVLLS